MLEYNDERHEYKLDGVVIPSVTQVLKMAGLIDFSGVPEHLLNKAAAFGTSAHKVIELYARGKLDLASVDPELKIYLNHWQKFTIDYNYKSDLVEQRGANSSLRVGYCIDHIGKIKNPVIVDIKTGQPKPSDEIQICAYGYVYPVQELYIVYINQEGYKVNKIKPTDRRRNERIFLSALAIANWKIEKGIK